MRLPTLVIVYVLLFPAIEVRAQDIIGFPRDDFGRVVLSSKQSFAGKFEAAIGQYDNEPISLYNKRSIFARLGRPVGRLDILTNIRVFPCTGFVISDKYILTNYHCVPGILEIPEVKDKGASRIDGVQFVLGYTREGIEEDAKRFTVSPTPVEKNKTLDYAILEVFGQPSKQFGIVTIGNYEPYDKQPFFIIGHPLGLSQRISREKCLSAAPAMSGGRVLHRCDTLPGNSGSPVFDQDTRTAIALHHAGSRRNSINYAIPFSRIIKSSPILQALLKQKKLKPITEPDAAQQSSAPQSANAPCDGVSVKLGTGGSSCINPGSGKSFRDCLTCPEMVVVPSGSFTMGTDAAEIARLKQFNDVWNVHAELEGPQHRVNMTMPFAVGKFEITRDQFDRFVKSSGHEVGDSCWLWSNGKWSHAKDKAYSNPGYNQSDSHPAACVSWQDTKAYVAWLSKLTGRHYRLPTEAEWEYVSRARTTTRYSFGDDSESICRFANGADNTKYRFMGNRRILKANCLDGYWHTAPVGSFRPNAWGLHDVHGNVSEWVEDCWNETYQGAPSNGSAWLDGDCRLRVFRGGSWYQHLPGLRSAFRAKSGPVKRVYGNGFRIVRQLSP